MLNIRIKIWMYGTQPERQTSAITPTVQVRRPYHKTVCFLDLCGENGNVRLQLVSCGVYPSYVCAWPRRHLLAYLTCILERRWDRHSEHVHYCSNTSSCVCEHMILCPTRLDVLVQVRWRERSAPTYTRVGAGMKHPHEIQTLVCRTVLF